MNRSSLNNNRSITTKTAIKMKSKKIAPISIGEGDHQMPEKEQPRRVSFHKDSSAACKQDRVETSRGSPFYYESRCHERQHDGVQDHVMAKTASCPAHYFQYRAKLPQIPKCTQDDEIVNVSHNGGMAASRGRRRVKSMPAGSLASQNFFGDPAAKPMLEEMEKLSENFALPRGKLTTNIHQLDKVEHPLALEEDTVPKSSAVPNHAASFNQLEKLCENILQGVRYTSPPSSSTGNIGHPVGMELQKKLDASENEDPAIVKRVTHGVQHSTAKCQCIIL